MPAVHRDARPADYGVHIYVYVRHRNLPVMIALAFDATRSGNKEKTENSKYRKKE